jgi:hypothetical protein
VTEKERNSTTTVRFVQLIRNIASSRSFIGTQAAIDSGEMTPKIPSLAALALLVFACSRSGKMQRDQKQYDVVPEGSASGVTSTINSPGETTPPVTDTNADTTTNFTIPNPNPLGNDTAGTPAPITSTAATAPRPQRPRLYTPPPRPQELRPDPPTDTTMTTTTDTETTTTTTTTAPNPKKKSDQDHPPPPPAPTDTMGTRG